MNNIQSQVLTTANTNIVAQFPPSVSNFLVVSLQHDLTSVARAITWSTDFKLATTGIDELTPNNYNVFTFQGRTDPLDNAVRWFLVGQPVLGAL